MLQRAPVLVCRFVAHGTCVGCGAVDVRVRKRLLTCFHCTGKIVAIEDKKRKLRETLRGQFLDVGAEIRRKLAEFKRA
jgi:hypothetical protein